MDRLLLSRRLGAIEIAAIGALTLLGALLLLAWTSQAAAAAPLVAKDGRIHACYKAKGRAKGTLRVVRNAKVRCPRGWKKAAWNAGGSSGAAGENGGSGAPGESGAGGTAGANGSVASLESKVSELLSKVKSLEGILAGVSNGQLLKAITAASAVETLCAQTVKLNEQTTSLGGSTAALNTVLDTVIPLFVPVAVPAALPPFACPSL
jgi:hypothetical protein